MPKKVFDIFPPKPPKYFRLEPLAPESFRASKGVGAKKGLILVLAVLISAGIFCYLTPPHWWGRAEIEIWPETEILEIEKEIEVREKMTESDPTLWIAQKAIPGAFLQEEKEASQQFSSSGIIEKKVLATGQIRVYNKYHEPITLIPGTRFMSDLGKQFHSLKKITIPAKGYIDAQVEADVPGQDYNIKPSKFSVPGLKKWGELFYSVWGESLAPMEGGLIGEVSQVTQKDLEEAEKILVEKLLKEGEESLKKNIPSDSILLEGALNQEIIEKFSLAKAGQELEFFISKAKVKSEALIFKKSDLESFAKEFIYSQIDQAKKLHEKSLKLRYEPRFIDLKTGKITLSLEITAKIYSDINVQEISEKVKGKSLAGGKNFLERMPGVFEAQVKIWPFWVEKIPENPEKIEIKLNLD